MFTLDSDLLGLMMALLTFLIPVITSIMEKRKKKRKEEISALQSGSEEPVQEQDIWDFLPDEPVRPVQETVSVAEEEETPHVEAGELEELFNDILVKEEGEAVTEQAVTEQEEELAEPVEEEILKEIPQVDKGLKKRIKENPKDMVLFTEILKPKFKEY